MFLSSVFFERHADTNLWASGLLCLMWQWETHLIFQCLLSPFIPLESIARVPVRITTHESKTLNGSIHFTLAVRAAPSRRERRPSSETPNVMAQILKK